MNDEMKWQDAVKLYAQAVGADAVMEVGGDDLVLMAHVSHDETSRCVVLHNANPDLIRTYWDKVEDGGVLCGLNYKHPKRDEVPEMFVMRAVAQVFPLLTVGLGPDGLWFVHKAAA